MQNKLFTLLACFILSTLMVLADGPFREHRYDAFKVATTNGQSIVFIGNSITNMHDWHSAFANHNVVNRGVSGGYATEILANLESYIYGKPDKVFLMIGTNDMAPNGLGHTPQQTAANIRKIVERIKKVSPDTEIYLTSIFPSTVTGRSLEKIQEANGLISDLAAEKGLVYIDLYEKLLGILDNTHSRDYLHLSMSGYRIWCKEVAEYVGSSCVYPDDAENNYPLNNPQYNMRASCWNATPVSADDVLMIGDEMINGGEWHEMLSCGNVKNYGTAWGYAGPPLTTTLASLPAIFTGRTENVAPAQVFLYAGVADVNGTDELDVVKERYQDVVDKIRELAPTTKINLMSLQPTANATTNTGRVEPFNAWMQTLAEGMDNAAFVDIYTDFKNDSDVGDSKYFKGNYLWGLGYAKVATILQPLISGATAMTEAEAEAQINLLNARNALGLAISNLSDLPFGTGVGQYPESKKQTIEDAKDAAYSVLTQDGVTVEELTAALTPINEAIASIKSSINQPTASTDETPVYYRLSTPLRGDRQTTSQGIGQTLLGEAQHNYITGAWKFVERTDGTWNIINGDNNGYLVYASSGMQVAADEPSYGWTLSAAATTGYYIITNGTNQLHQANTSPYKLINWGSGTNTTDGGCQFEIELFEDPQPAPTLPEPLLSMKRITLDGTAPIRINDAEANPVLAHKGSSTIVIDYTSAASNSAKQTLIGSSNSSVDNRFLTAAVWGNKYSLVYRTEGADSGDQLFTNDLGTGTARHQIIYTIDNENQLVKYYLDGELKSTYDYATHSAWKIASLGNLPGVDGLYLGGVVTSSESNKYPFTGEIHSVRVYPEALNALQIELIEYVDHADRLEAVINDCKDELAMAGKVGYPAADDATVAPFQAACDAACEALVAGIVTEDIYNTHTTTLEVARTAYKSVTNVVMPESGKAYTITSLQPENDLYFYMDATGLKLSTTKKTTDDAVFVCTKVGDKYVFVNAQTGAYLVNKSDAGGYNSNSGHTATYNEVVCTFRLYSGNAAITHDKAFGSLAIVGHNSGNGTGKKYAPFTISPSGGMNKYSKADGTMPTLQINSSWSTVERLEEVTDYKYNLPTLQEKDGKTYATLFLPYATTLPEGVEAYYAAETPNNNVIQMTQIEGATLPKNTAVVLVGTEAGEKRFVPAIEAGTAPTTNNLYGTMAADEAVSTGYKNYALTGKYETIGFHVFTGAKYTPGKAYLRVAEGSAPVLVMNFGGETTGIDSMDNGQWSIGNTPVFDLSGRRVKNPSKGLYIIGGKKVYVK